MDMFTIDVSFYISDKPPPETQDDEHSSGASGGKEEEKPESKLMHKFFYLNYSLC